MHCIEFNGARTTGGYGSLRVNGIVQYAHRLVFERAWQFPIPLGMVVMHTCDTPACINPLHLQLGTQADNVRDMAAKGRHGRYNAAKTHCSNGHEFDEANTYVTPKGKRNCRTCNREAVRRSRA